MPSIIQAGNAASTGLVTTGATDGILELRSGTAAGGTVAMTINAAGAVAAANGLAVTGSISSTTGANFATTSGNVGIGTASPTHKLEVIGGVIRQANAAATSTAKNFNVLVSLGSNGNGADGCIQITDAVANNVWIGQNVGGAYVMSNTNGVRLSSGGTSWASDSDERLKVMSEWEPITDASAKIVTLRTGVCRYKTDAVGTRRAFLIAQDVQQVQPEAIDVQGDADQTLGIRYTEVIPLMIAAIQEQQALIESLTTRLTALEGSA